MKRRNEQFADANEYLKELGHSFSSQYRESGISKKQFEHIRSGTMTVTDELLKKYLRAYPQASYFFSHEREELMRLRVENKLQKELIEQLRKNIELLER